MTAARAKSRLLLTLIVAISAAPLVAALVWYFNADSWRSEDTVNHGHLVAPARPVESRPLPLLDGGKLAPNWFQHRWTLVYVGASECDARCRHVLYVTRQIRLGLGADMNRVQRLFAMPGDPPAATELRRAHPGLTVVDTTRDRGFAAQFTHGAPPGARIYLVDPRGRLMMSYAADADPKGILADLKRLLKYSQIG